MNSLLSLILVVTENRDDLIRKFCNKIVEANSEEDTSMSRLRMYVNDTINRQSCLLIESFSFVMTLAIDKNCYFLLNYKYWWWFKHNKLYTCCVQSICISWFSVCHSNAWKQPTHLHTFQVFHRCFLILCRCACISNLHCNCSFKQIHVVCINTLCSSIIVEA